MNVRNLTASLWQLMARTDNCSLCGACRLSRVDRNITLRPKSTLVTQNRQSAAGFLRCGHAMVQ